MKLTTYPTPLTMLQAKRAGKIITIRLPDGRNIRLGEYLRSWRKLLTLDGKTQIENWDWFPQDAGAILRKISAGVHDRINRRLPWFSQLGKQLSEDDIAVKKNNLVRRGLLRCECRWCGSSIGRYVSHNSRFCDASCRRAYSL